MLFWGIEACRHSRYIQRIFVSTEDPSIAGVAESLGATVILRPIKLAGDDVPKQRVICHAVGFIKRQLGISPDIIVALQPNSPEVDEEHLDAAIELFRRFQRQEIFSVDDRLMQNAAFRILSRDAACSRMLSVHAGVFVAPYIDVHTEADVAEIERRGVLAAREIRWGLKDASA